MREKDTIGPFTLLRELITFQKGKYAVRILGLTIYFLSPLLTTFLIKEIFEYLDGNPTINLGLWTIILLIPVIALVRIGVNIFNVIIEFMFVQSVQVLLRSNLLGGILKQPGAKALMNSSPGEAISRFRGDSMEIAWYVSFTGYVLSYGLFFVISFSLMFQINYRATLLVTLPYFLVLLVIYKARNKQKEYRRVARRTAGQVTGMVGETFSAIQSIKVARAEHGIRRYFDSLGEERRDASVKDSTFQAIIRGFGRMMLSFSSGILLFSVGQDMQAGTFSVGDFAFFIFLLGWMQGYINTLAELIPWQARASVSYQRMYRLIRGVREDSTPNELIETHDVHLKTPYQPKPHHISNEARNMKSLSVKGLSVSHGENESDFSLNNVSFDIKKGEYVAVVGKVGSGKTTLLRAVLGLLQVDRGEFYWNSERITQPSEFFVPPISSYTPQLPTLFSDSIRENLLMGLDKDEKEVVKASDLAILTEDLKDFEDGLETVIGPKGIKLSGGQKYRVAAARMLLRESELIVVDDLSSALDVKTEEQLWNGLFENKDNTFLVVSHRPNVLRRADKIIVLHEGRLVASGKLDELIEKNEIMQEIWSTITKN